MRASPPCWYVVMYRRDPPVAVPLSSVSAVGRFCDRLRARSGEAHVTIELLDARRTRLLETMVAGSAEAKRRALVSLNRHMLNVMEWWPSLWACGVCDGTLYEQTDCGCCGTPDCAVRCGCRCPSEFATCDGCDERAASCACANVDEQLDQGERCSSCERIEYITELGCCVSCVHELELKYGDEECIVCGRPGELDNLEWCPSCKRQHAIDTETCGDDNDGSGG